MATKADHVVVFDTDYSVCTGCKSCEIMCSLVHDGVSNPVRAGIHIEVGPIKTMMHTIHVCEQCDDHPCYEACPRKDRAMRVDENGIVYVVRQECIGCGKCAKACPQAVPAVHVARLNGKRFAVKCDLCREIEGGPACVRNCPAMKLGLFSRVGEATKPTPEYQEELSQVIIPAGYVVDGKYVVKKEA